MAAALHVLVTGASGLLGGQALARMLAARPQVHAWVLVRDLGRWVASPARRQLPRARVTPLVGDLTRDGLGLEPWLLSRLQARVQRVLHAAADTSFSRPLAAARRVNLEGTRRVVELAGGCRHLERFVHVSTAFVAGRRVGRLPEQIWDEGPGWVNAYERSKHEAEAAVGAAGLPAVIARSSTVVCDDLSGAFTQVNAVHRALRLQHAGLASLLPGSPETPVDLVTTGFTAAALAELTLGGETLPPILHLCAGQGALPLRELLETAHEVWSEDESWRRRRIPLPALTDLETYRLFERTVEETGDPRLARVTRSLAHFVPQLALPKLFLTSAAESALGRPAPAVREFWRPFLQRLAHLHRPRSLRRAG